MEWQRFLVGTDANYLVAQPSELIGEEGLILRHAENAGCANKRRRAGVYLGVATPVVKCEACDTQSIVWKELPGKVLHKPSRGSTRVGAWRRDVTRQQEIVGKIAL